MPTTVMMQGRFRQKTRRVFLLKSPATCKRVAILFCCFIFKYTYVDRYLLVSLNLTYIYIWYSGYLIIFVCSFELVDAH